MNIVHSDLKPENVALDVTDAGMHVRIIDFGYSIQCEDDRLMVPKDVPDGFTDGYWQPWTRDGDTWDGRRADVFSFGVILWMVLACHCMPDNGPIDWNVRLRHALYHAVLTTVISQNVFRNLRPNSRSIPHPRDLLEMDSSIPFLASAYSDFAPLFVDWLLDHVSLCFTCSSISSS